MKKLTLYLVSIILLLPLHLSAAVSDATAARYLQGLPIAGEIFANQKGVDEGLNSHESGVFYHNISQDLFADISFTYRKGSLKNNLTRMASKYGWKIFWELSSDYNIPSGFTLTNKKMPEMFAVVLEHIPVKVIFYSKNKVITVHPMYDKRETDVGGKYSIDDLESQQS